MLGRLTRTIATALAASALCSGGALAATFKPFSEAALAAAQAEGRPVVVEAHAWWCSTCRAQEPALKNVAKDPAFDDLIILKMDYDKEKKARRALGIQQQSTLIAFHGAEERARSVGDTKEGSIGALLLKSLK